MQKKLIFVLLFFSCGISAMQTETKTYHYTTPLCLNLVMGQYASFLAEGKTKPEQEWYDALNDAIILRNKNKREASSPSTEEMLAELQNILNKKITKIENQISNQYRLDYESLAMGTAFLTAGVAFAALTYYFYKYKYQKNNLEYQQIVEKLEKIGVRVSFPWYSNTITVDCPRNVYCRNEANRLAKLANDNGSLVPGFILGIGFTCAMVPYAANGFLNSLDPNADNQYLQNYKNLLQYVEQLQKD